VDSRSNWTIFTCFKIRVTRSARVRDMKFPNDENGDILAKMLERGDDLSKSRKIDFYFVFPEKLQADKFAEQARLRTDSIPEVEHYEERNMWEATVSKNMIPTHREITELEAALDQIAQLYEGEADGWGCFIVKS
jgi:hypothetical protein